MAAPLDVPGRLAEGLDAVGDIQLYAQACAARGYHHQDLTGHGAQVYDWYGTEDGLDLRSLDADCAVLRAVSRLAADALDVLRSQVAVLDSGWDGDGGSAARDFVRRHLDTAAQVVAATQTAATAAEVLRDEVWRRVDAKVEATLRLGDATASRRPAWVSAAQSVRSGQGTEAAGAIVDSEITPYVDTTVVGEWVPAMKAAAEAVDAAYRAAAEALRSRPAAQFDIPGDFGPRMMRSSPATRVVSEQSSPAPSVPVAATVPAAAVEPVAPLADPPESPAPVVAPPAAATVPGGTLPAMPDPAGALPGGLPDPLGALFDKASTGEGPALPEPAGVPELDSDELREEEQEQDEDDLEALRAKVLEAAEDVAVEETPPEPEVAPEPEASTPTPDCPEPEAEVEAASPAEEPDKPPVPAAPPPDPAATPCEIAADELPQVGQ